MQIEVNTEEKAIIKKALDSYLSELRLEIVETKHDKTALHAEENLVKNLLQKVA